MRKCTLIFCFLVLVSYGHTLFAQESGTAPDAVKAPPAPAHFYHLDFVVQELGADGKPTNSRTYTAIVSTDARDHGTSIRTGSRIPVPTGSSASASNEAVLSTNFQYVDVGVNIDARNARELGRQLSLDLVADVSSIAPTDDGRIRHPVIRQNKWQSSVLIPIGKASVIFTSDSLDSKSSMQVIATVTAMQ